MKDGFIKVAAASPSLRVADCAYNRDQLLKTMARARELGVKSIPVNLLNPIPGTPYENRVPLDNEEACRCVALFRFLIPDASIRLAGGRGLLGD